MWRERGVARGGEENGIEEEGENEVREEPYGGERKTRG